MDDLLKELRRTDEDLAELSDAQLVAFLECLVEAVDEPWSGSSERATTRTRRE